MSVPISEQQAEQLRRFQQGKEVYRGDSFHIRFGSLCENVEIGDILSGIRKKQFTRSRTKVSSRVVNHWEAEGVVEDPRNEGRGWRRYSVVDLAWLCSIMELRQFGVPTDTLRQALTNIQKFGRSKVSPTTPRLFEFYVLLALQRVPVYLLVYSDGDIELATEHEYKSTPLLSPLADHVRIELNGVLQKLFPKFDLSPEYRPGTDLSDKEFIVILALRRSRNKRVTIRLKDGEPYLLETERDGTGKPVRDLLTEAPNSELTLKQQDGKTVHLSQILKQKL